MQKRPAIPSELARRILVEAGHRCAIHTCRHPAVDVHHIDPWSEVRAHSYPNLIALCPNCHRRADRGEIDRLSLRIYKRRLLSGEASNHAEAEVVRLAVVEAPPWRVLTLRDNREEVPRYEVEFDYPFFVEVGADISEINDLERAAAVARLQEFRQSQFSAHSADDGPQLGSSFSSSFEILCAVADVISIRHRLFHYGSGAAHPNHWTAVSNYQRNPVCAVRLRDLFGDVDYVSVLSRECIADLVKQRQLGQPTEEVLLGAGPNEENFTRFNISPEGLVINFDEYTVGSYVEGPFTVVIPTQAIASILRTNAPISRYLLRGAG